MRKIKFLVLGLVLAFSSQIAQAQDSTYIANEYAKALALYNTAQRYNDAALSKQALIEMSILNPGDTAVLRTLAELYYNSSAFVSSTIVALDMMAVDPNSQVAQEIAALSYENLRLYDKAIEQYEKMWLTSENVNILYQIAYLQYSLQRFTEAKTNLDILDSKVTDEDKIALNKSDGSVQEVNFSAAMSNIRGLIALEEGNSEEAKGHFSKALEINPDFEAAKLSLDGINKN